MLFFFCVSGNGAEILSTCFYDLNSNLLVDFSFQKSASKGEFYRSEKFS